MDYKDFPEYKQLIALGCQEISPESGEYMYHEGIAFKSGIRKYVIFKRGKIGEIVSKMQYNRRIQKYNHWESVKYKWDFNELDLQSGFKILLAQINSDRTGSKKDIVNARANQNVQLIIKYIFSYSESRKISQLYNWYNKIPMLHWDGLIEVMRALEEKYSAAAINKFAKWML